MTIIEYNTHPQLHEKGLVKKACIILEILRYIHIITSLPIVRPLGHSMSLEMRMVRSEPSRLARSILGMSPQSDQYKYLEFQTILKHNSLLYKPSSSPKTKRNKSSKRVANKKIHTFQNVKNR